MPPVGVIKYELVHPNAVPPQRQTRHSVGYDLTCVEGIELEPAPCRPIALDTGVRFHMSYPDYIELRSRSSAFAAGLLVYPGIIDPDFHETVKVLVGHMIALYGVIKPGVRLAQFILAPGQTLEPLEHYPDAYIAEDLPQRAGGLGSTGR